jgi:hypothetical protein
MFFERGRNQNGLDRVLVREGPRVPATGDGAIGITDTTGCEFKNLTYQSVRPLRLRNHIEQIGYS